MKIYWNISIFNEQNNFLYQAIFVAARILFFRNYYKLGWVTVVSYYLQIICYLYESDAIVPHAYVLVSSVNVRFYPREPMMRYAACGNALTSQSDGLRWSGIPHRNAWMELSLTDSIPGLAGAQSARHIYVSTWLLADQFV